MDRIRKAMDLAREERSRRLEPHISEESTARRETPRPAAGGPANSGAATGAPRSIEYTNTRVFVPSSSTLESNRILGPNAKDAAAAAFRMLRTQVLQRMEEHAWQTLAVLSPGPNDGKTTTAINLALCLANDRRHTVLLVDADLRSPTIAAAFGLAPEFGFDDVLRGDATIEQCLYHPEGHDRIVLLPARGSLANSSELLAGPVGRAVVDELRSRYVDRLLLFDLPPLLAADDAVAFLPLLDCGLLVVAERITRREDLLRSMELVRSTPIVGTVLNKASDVTSGYG